MATVQEAYGIVSSMIGKKGHNVLDKTDFLKGVRQINEHIAARIEESVSEIENPSFELSGKCMAGYNIAGLRIKDGKGNVVGKGAVSIIPDWDGNQHVIKSRLILPNGIYSKGSECADDCMLHLESVYTDGKIINEYYRSGDLVNMSPLDTVITKKDGGKYFNKDGCPIVEHRHNFLKENLANDLSFHIHDACDGLYFKCGQCELETESDGGIYVSIADYKDLFEGEYPILNLSLTPDLKIKERWFQLDSDLEPGGPGLIDRKEFAEPLEIPDKILNKSGFKEILERLKVIQEIQAESKEHLRRYTLLEKFCERFYDSRIEKTEQSTLKKPLTTAQVVNTEDRPDVKTIKPNRLLALLQKWFGF